jgi:hypothetical protein
MNLELIKSIIEGQARIFSLENKNYAFYFKETAIPKRGDEVAVFKKGVYQFKKKYRSKTIVPRYKKDGTNAKSDVYYILGDKYIYPQGSCRTLHELTFEEVKYIIEHRAQKAAEQREQAALRVKEKTGANATFIDPRHLGGAPQRNEPCTCGSGKKYKKCCL